MLRATTTPLSIFANQSSSRLLRLGSLRISVRLVRKRVSSTGSGSVAVPRVGGVEAGFLGMAGRGLLSFYVQMGQATSPAPVRTPSAAASDAAADYSSAR